MPSRTLDWLEIETAAPEVLFIACCGYSLQRTLADLPILTRQSGWTKLPSTQSGRVYVFDGNAYFSRPGPRLVESLELLAHSLHPHIHPLPNTATHELMRRLRQVPVETNWNKLAQL
jgi:iron complex transport system substrate-binding protein